MAFSAFIFDMDGLLINSEPLWEEAGKSVLLQYGKQLSSAQYACTTGLRTAEWLNHWFSYFELDKADINDAETRIISLVCDKVTQQGQALPGVDHIFSFAKAQGFLIGLATSSPTRLADIVIEKLNIRPHLTAIASAEFLDFGKPHPEVYLNCASEMGVPPNQCICFEDSFNGMVSVKAAKMTCVVVPAEAHFNMACWGAADYKLSSLLDFNSQVISDLKQ